MGWMREGVCGPSWMWLWLWLCLGEAAEGRASELAWRIERGWWSMLDRTERVCLGIDMCSDMDQVLRRFRYYSRTAQLRSSLKHGNAYTWLLIWVSTRGIGRLHIAQLQEALRKVLESYSYMEAGRLPQLDR